MVKTHKHDEHELLEVYEHYGTLVARFSNKYAVWTVMQNKDGILDSMGPLHNIDGPALIYNKTQKTYAFLGTCYSKVKWKKLASQIKFKKDFNGLLGENE